MNILARLLPFCLPFACIAGPAGAQAISPLETSSQVRDIASALAFDPAKFFRDEFSGDPSIIRIAYTGDDHGWPVYSIAIAQGCLEGEARSRDCGSRLTARMVRSPAPPDLVRPRQRGAQLVRHLMARGATSRSAIRSNLRSLGVEWLEADVRACPGTSLLLSRSAQLAWVPEGISNPDLSEIMIVVHADIVHVVFEEHLRSASYRGYVAEGSPGEWANELAETLDPCWRPARVAPPWAR